MTRQSSRRRPLLERVLAEFSRHFHDYLTALLETAEPQERYKKSR